MAGQKHLKLLKQLAALRATKVYRGYKSMLFNGLPMWAWELYINGLLIPDELDAPPPKSQWIVLRPNVGLQLKFSGLDNSQADFALALEPFGYVRYLDDSDYRKWWSASPLITITNDNGMGFGGLARYKNYTLGATYHDKGDDVLMYVSVDLYDYLLGEKGKVTLANEFFEKVKQKIPTK
jgi:hypothetical protein